MLIYNGGILNVDSGIAMNEDCCCTPGADPCCYCQVYPATPSNGFSSACHPFKFAFFDVDTTLSSNSMCPGDTITATLTITNNNAGTEVISPYISLAKFGEITGTSFTAGGVLSSSGNLLPCDISNYSVEWASESFASGETKVYSITFTIVTLNRKWPSISDSASITGSFTQVPCSTQTAWSIFYVESTTPCDEVGEPCESCLSLIGYTVDIDPFLVAVALSEVTLVPDQVCNGQEATLTFKILNSTGEVWANDCPPGGEADCSVFLDMFTSGTAITVLSTSPAGTVTTVGNDVFIEWGGQSFAIGEEKTYSMTFRMEGCVSDLGWDCYYGRGYRGSITLDCIPCP